MLFARCAGDANGEDDPDGGGRDGDEDQSDVCDEYDDDGVECSEDGAGADCLDDDDGDEDDNDDEDNDDDVDDDDVGRMSLW